MAKTEQEKKRIREEQRIKNALQLNKDVISRNERLYGKNNIATKISKKILITEDYPRRPGQTFKSTRPARALETAVYNAKTMTTAPTRNIINATKGLLKKKK